MLFRRVRRIEPLLDPVVDKILEELAQHGTETKEYEQNLSHLERVCKIRNEQKSRRISPDTIAMVLGNLFGILIIVAYEQKNVITSKGLGFVMRTSTQPKTGS